MCILRIIMMKISITINAIIKLEGFSEHCGRAYYVKTKFLHREGVGDERSEEQVCVGVGGLAC